MTWKRMQLFEIADREDFPSELRTYMVSFLDRLHQMVGSADVLAERMATRMQTEGLERVQDFCSGHAGLASDVFQRLQTSKNGLRWSLSDKFPQEVSLPEGMVYHTDSLDVTDVAAWPIASKTLYTIFCAFHHFTPEQTRRILEHAQQHRLPICIFEMSNNAQPKYIWWLAILSAFLTCLLLTPTIKGVTARQLLFTYILPILPFCIAWDGAVSNARTYTPADLQQLTAGLDAGYTWEIEEISGKAPMPMLCLWGHPI